MNDERALVERLRERFGTDATHVRYGIGDDAAVVRLEDDSVLTVDVAVEGVHFRRDFAPLDVLAARAFHAAASDVAAMGAAPSCALVSLVLPRLGDGELDAILHGLARASRRVGAPIVGGNTSRGPSIAISTTVIGRTRAPIMRSGARVGDVIYVTGPTGDRALGLEVLLRGGSTSLPETVRPDAEAFVRAWRTPEARIVEGLALVGVATSAIDLSDGLAMDLDRLARASGVGAVVRAGQLTCGPAFTDVARALGRDPQRIALTGGEAYELLFTAPRDATLPIAATAIGAIVAGEGVSLEEHGATRPLAPEGFDHLAG